MSSSIFHMQAGELTRDFLRDASGLCLHVAGGSTLVGNVDFTTDKEDRPGFELGVGVYPRVLFCFGKVMIATSVLVNEKLDDSGIAQRIAGLSAALAPQLEGKPVSFFFNAPKGTTRWTTLVAGEQVDLAARYGLDSIQDMCVDVPFGKLLVFGVDKLTRFPVMVTISPDGNFETKVAVVSHPVANVEWSAAWNRKTISILKIQDNFETFVSTLGRGFVHRDLPRSTKVFTSPEGDFLTLGLDGIVRIMRPADDTFEELQTLKPGEDLIGVAYDGFNSYAVISTEPGVAQRYLAL